MHIHIWERESRRRCCPKRIDNLLHKRYVLFVVIECSLMLHIFYVATLTINLCRIKINVKKTLKRLSGCSYKTSNCFRISLFFIITIYVLSRIVSLFYSFKIMLQDVKNTIFYCAQSFSCAEFTWAFCFSFQRP